MSRTQGPPTTPHAKDKTMNRSGIDGDETLPIDYQSEQGLDEAFEQIARMIGQLDASNWMVVKRAVASVAAAAIGKVRRARNPTQV
jgi:hypothetical protein